MGPAGLCVAFVGVAVLAIFRRAFHDTPAWDESIDSFDACDAEFEFVDGAPDALDALDVIWAVATMVGFGLVRDDEAFAFVHSERED